MSARPESRRIWVFILVWFGQLISLVGSGLTSFALGVWVYQRTGSVTQFALITLFATLPSILLSPFAGALVDRWDRRRAMLLSDSGAGATTLLIAIWLWQGRLEILQIYLAVAIISVFGAFRWPAYSATTSLLVPERHLGRANGLIQMGQAVSQIFSPLIAAWLLGVFPIQYLILVDFGTFLFAVTTLLFVRFPKPAVSPEARVAKKSLLREAALGWTYLTARNGLFGMLILFAIGNFLTSIVMILAMPLILTMASVDTLGQVLSIAGSGMLVGSLIMSVWGGPKPRIYGVLNFMLLAGFCLILGGVQPSVLLLTVAAFVFFFCLPIVNGSSQAIWQRKIAPDIQGRVFAVSSMVAFSVTPLANLLAGPLADRIFEPLMALHGPLAVSVGQVIGVGPGRGIALLFIVLGFFLIGVTIVAYLNPHIRCVERELPDAVANSAPGDIDSITKPLTYESTLPN